MVAHFSIQKWHLFHFDVLFSNGSQGYFFDYKLVNIWLDKINLVAFLPRFRERLLSPRTLL